MKMIHLRFENAGLFPDPSLLSSEEKKGYYFQARGSKNFANPVTVNIVANVLRALANDIPVPTLRPTNIAKNPIYEELVSNAYVRYDLPMVDEKGHPMFLETFTTASGKIGLARYVDGDIYCPVTDNLIEAISDGARVATILDGGLLYIVEIENCDAEWLELNGYTKVMTLEEALNFSQCSRNLE